MRYLGRRSTPSIVQDVEFQPYAIWTTVVEEEEFYEDHLPKSSRLQDVIEGNKEDYPPIDALCVDVFGALYKYFPKLNPKNSVEAEFILNYGAVKTLMDSNRYKEIRSITRHDELASLMGAELFVKEALEVIQTLKEEHSEALTNYNEALKELKEALKDKDKNPFDAEEAKKKLEEAREELEKLYKEEQTRELVSKSDHLFNDVNEIKEVMNNWGLGHDQTYQRMPYQDKMNMIDKLKNNKKLKEISKLAGKLKEIFMEGEKAKTKKVNSQIDDITQGNNIPRLLPTELMMFHLPETRLAFYKKYSQRKLLQHEYSGKRKKGKGPIVALIDSSGSMGGQNEIYAKAVCMTLLDLSKRQNRNFMVVHFDSAPASSLHINKFSKKNPYNIKEVVDLAEYFCGGGTDFEQPLLRAKTEINDENEFTKADIVMITDGCSAVGDKFLNDYKEWKEKKNISIFSVLIDEGGWSNTDTLELFSDEIRKISDMAKGDGYDVAKALAHHLI